jgi:hypothetical protein
MGFVCLPVNKAVMVRVETPDTVTVALVGHAELLRHAIVELVDVDVGVVVGVLEPTMQEHALESFDNEDEHGDAKAGIDGAGATV